MYEATVFDVTSNQTIDGDFKLVSDLNIELRAEVEGEERSYFFHVRCTDSSGNDSNSSITSRVPQDDPSETLVTRAPASLNVGRLPLCASVTWLLAPAAALAVALTVLLVA